MMKLLKLLLFGVCILAIHTSCGGFGTGGEAEIFRHNLYLSFVDAAGNDLVEGIETLEPDMVSRGMYTLDVFPKGYTGTPQLYLGKRSESDPFELSFRTTTEWKVNTAMLRYTLTCPHVFGDEERHEIVTFWENSSKGRPVNRNNLSVCIGVVIDGEQVLDMTHSSDKRDCWATITLDR